MKLLKSIILILSAIILSYTSAFADWTLTASKVSRAGHYVYWKILCTSDGNDPSAINVLSSSYMSDALLRDIQGSTMLIMDVMPGTGGVAPNNTIDITMSNSLIDIYSDTGISYTTNTPGKDLSEDYNQYPPILNALYLDVNDIGDSGDQVTFAFLVWKESL